MPSKYQKLSREITDFSVWRTNFTGITIHFMRNLYKNIDEKMRVKVWEVIKKFPAWSKTREFFEKRKKQETKPFLSCLAWELFSIISCIMYQKKNKTS